MCCCMQFLPERQELKLTKMGLQVSAPDNMSNESDSLFFQFTELAA